jgi:aminoglycoside phosphotransferase (APT) family kinase protein
MNHELPIPQIDLQHVLVDLDIPDATLISSESRATDTRVWKVRQGENTLAIRVFRPEQRRVMELETSCMRLAREHGLPVPRIYRTGLVDQQFPAMAIEWIEGSILADELLATPIRANRLGVEAGRVLARIHEIPATQADETTGWIERGVVDDFALETLLRDVQTSPASLLHLDYHPFNLITRHSRICGVLDWTNAAFGDPRADVARTLSTMRLVAPQFIARFGAHRMTMSLFTRGFLKGYEEKRGPLTGLEPFLAWAGSLILRDLGSKMHALPIQDPGQFVEAVSNWTQRWRRRALDSSSTPPKGP